MGVLESGLKGEARTAVTADLTAAAMGSGSLPVYATPALVVLLEAAAVDALAGSLPEGQTTVGVRMEVDHLAATPLGADVRARALLTEVEGRRLVFEVEAHDNWQCIGKGRHLRVLVDTTRFMEKLQKPPVA